MFTPLFVGGEIFLKQIREEEDLQNYKDYKELNQDNDPYAFTPRIHIPESFDIETYYAGYY